MRIRGVYDSPLMTEPEPDALDTRRRRLLYRATHRGTHENDLLIGGFIAPRLAGFSEDELASLEALMDMLDADLADYLTGRRPIPQEADTPMLRRIKAAADAGEAIPGKAISGSAISGRAGA